MQCILLGKKKIKNGQTEIENDVQGLSEIKWFSYTEFIEKTKVHEKKTDLDFVYQDTPCSYACVLELRDDSIPKNGDANKNEITIPWISYDKTETKTKGENDGYVEKITTSHSKCEVYPFAIPNVFKFGQFLVVESLFQEVFIFNFLFLKKSSKTTCSRLRNAQ